MTIDIAYLVRRWFGSVGQANGPLLPDGWFGRPHDNILFLKDIHLLNDSLMIHLNDNTTLKFDGPVRAFVDKSDLVFDGFLRATLSWKHYGGGEDAPYHELTYDEGQVRLGAPMGTKSDLK